MIWKTISNKGRKEAKIITRSESLFGRNCLLNMKRCHRLFIVFK